MKQIARSREVPHASAAAVAGDVVCSECKKAGARRLGGGWQETCSPKCARDRKSRLQREVRVRRRRERFARARGNSAGAGAEDLRGNSTKPGAAASGSGQRGNSTKLLIAIHDVVLVRWPGSRDGTDTKRVRVAWSLHHRGKSTYYGHVGRTTPAGQYTGEWGREERAFDEGEVLQLLSRSGQTRRIISGRGSSSTRARRPGARARRRRTGRGAARRGRTVASDR